MCIAPYIGREMTRSRRCWGYIAKRKEAKEEEVAVSWRTLYSAMASRNSPSRMCNMVMPVDRILQSE